MSTRLGVIASTDGTVSSRELPSSLRQAGGNTGNLLFHRAASDLVDTDLQRFDWDAAPEEVAERCDHLLIPEANAANPARDYSDRADFLRRAGLPCIVVGLGAQAGQLGDEIELRAGTIDYLRELSDRSERIGVRGEYTAEVLNRIGVTNTAVTGCPANLLSADPLLHEAISERAASGSTDLVQIGGGDMKRSIRPIERRLFELACRPGSRYVAQSGLTALAAGGARLTTKQLLKVHRHLAKARALPGATLRMLAEYGAIHTDADDWLKATTRFDLAVSTRVHATIVALQAGVPAVVIHHDSRTEELARTLAIPSLPAGAAKRATLSEFAGLARGADWVHYGARRSELQAELASIVAAAGLPLGTILSVR